MKYEWIVEIDDDEGFHLEEAKWKQEVVRCKDCKYRTVDNDVVRYNCGLHLVVNLNDDDFCSRGKRR